MPTALIEYLPSNQGCAAMCSHCNMKANKSKERIEMTKVAQNTLSFLEGFLKDMRYKYHFASISNTEDLPNYEYPDQVTGLTLQYEHKKVPESELKTNISEFSNRIQTLLTKKALNLNHLSISIVPQKHTVEERDRLVARLSIDSLSEWFPKDINISFKVNQLNRKRFDDESQLIIASQKTLKELIGTYSENQEVGEEGPQQYDDLPGSASKGIRCSYSVSRDGRMLSINHRVISSITPAPMNVTAVYEFNMQTSYITFPPEYPPMFMITGNDVVLIHNPKHIDNPIFRINHEDFRKTLSKMHELYPEDSLIDHINEIIFQNRAIYQFIRERNNIGEILSSFQQIREECFDGWAEHKKMNIRK